MRVFAESMSGFVKLVSLSVDSKFLKNLRFSSQSKSSSHDEFPDDEFLKFKIINLLFDLLFNNFG